MVDRVVRGLTVEPGLLLEPLGARMAALASAGRFEEAADIRDCAAALARALHRQRRLEGLRRAGRIELLAPDGQGAVLDGGRLLAPGTLLDPPPSHQQFAGAQTHYAGPVRIVERNFSQSQDLAEKGKARGEGLHGDADMRYARAARG